MILDVFCHVYVLFLCHCLRSRAPFKGQCGTILTVSRSPCTTLHGPCWPRLLQRLFHGINWPGIHLSPGWYCVTFLVGRLHTVLPLFSYTHTHLLMSEHSFVHKNCHHMFSLINFFSCFGDPPPSGHGCLSFWPEVRPFSLFISSRERGRGEVTSGQVLRSSEEK